MDRGAGDEFDGQQQGEGWPGGDGLADGVVAGVQLLTRRWRVLRSDVPLITSDAPVTLWSPGVPGDERASPPGIATARMIVLPLDRHTALAMVHADGDKVVEAPARRALQINTAVANNAHRWIFHHPDDAPLADVRIDPPAVVSDEIRGARAHDDGSVGILHWLVKRPAPRTQPH